MWNALSSRGRYEKELKELQRQSGRDPKNLRLQIKIGDLLSKMGKRTEALETYRGVSEKYAAAGFVVQAIALNKLILRLDPSQKEAYKNLADLYAEKEKIQEEQGETAKEDLPAIPLFSDLKKEELSRVMQKIRARRFTRGKIICREGESGDSIFIISEGRVGIFRQTGPGEKIRINELKEGEFFGEFGFFADSRRHASVEALEDTEVLEIGRKELSEVIREFPGVSAILFKFYRERVLDSLLATSKLFQSLSPGERKEVLGGFTEEAFPEGVVVMEEGGQGDSLYIIKKGEAEVFSRDAKGALITLGKLKEGDFFGEISLLTGRPRTASVRVLKPAELMRLGKGDFERIISRHPEVMRIAEESSQIRMEGRLRALGVFREIREKGEMV